MGYGGSRESGEGRGEGGTGYGRISQRSDYGYGGRGAESFGERESSSSMRGKGPKGYTRSDDRIKEDVCERFSDDDFLDASNIEISVDDGEVTLSGEVSDRRAKRMAEDLAEECSGVKNVQNNIRVRQETTTDQNSSTQQASGSRTESSKRASGGS